MEEVRWKTELLGRGVGGSDKKGLVWRRLLGLEIERGVFGIKGRVGRGVGFEIGVEDDGFDELKIFENNLLLAELFGGDEFDVDGGIAIGFGIGVEFAVIGTDTDGIGLEFEMIGFDGGIGLEFEVIGIDTDTDGIEMVVGKFEEAVVTIGGRLINEVVAMVVVVVVVVGVVVLMVVMGKVWWDDEDDGRVAADESDLTTK